MGPHRNCGVLKFWKRHVSDSNSMKITAGVALVELFSLAAAAIRLSAAGVDPALAGQPVNVVGNKLVVGGCGVRFEGVLEDDQLLCEQDEGDSPHCGVAVGHRNRRLTLSGHPSTGFYQRGGWLEYSGRPYFVARESSNGFEIFAGTSHEIAGADIMLQVQHV